MLSSRPGSPEVYETLDHSVPPSPVRLLESARLSIDLGPLPAATGAVFEPAPAAYSHLIAGETREEKIARIRRELAELEGDDVPEVPAAVVAARVLVPAVELPAQATVPLPAPLPSALAALEQRIARLEQTVGLDYVAGATPGGVVGPGASIQARLEDLRAAVAAPETPPAAASLSALHAALTRLTAVRSASPAATAAHVVARLHSLHSLHLQLAASASTLSDVEKALGEAEAAVAVWRGAVATIAAAQPPTHP